METYWEKNQEGLDVGNERRFLEIDLKNVRSLGLRNSTCASKEAGKRNWFRSHAELKSTKVKQEF